MELPEFPSQFHPEMRLGLRIALMEFVIREINNDLMNNMDTVIKKVMSQNRKLDRPGAFILITKQIDQKTKPYINFINTYKNQMSTTLGNAMKVEKSGKEEAAIILYEELASQSFTSPMPHDRLRILYTKKHEYDKAIYACERYIDILKSFDEFDHDFSNVHLIPNYLKHIEKLKLKLPHK